MARRLVTSAASWKSAADLIMPMAVRVVATLRVAAVIA
jgi:hypothetical protein